MSDTVKIKIRGYHLDMYGHVNNARYLEFLEEARWRFVEQRISIAELKQEGFAFVIVQINISYRRPVTLDQVLEIRTRLVSLGQKSGTVHQEVLFADSSDVAADADVTFVVVDTRLGKAVPIEGKLRAAFEAE